MCKIHGGFECLFYNALRLAMPTRTLLNSVKTTMVNVSTNYSLKNQIRYIAVIQFIRPIEIVYSRSGNWKTYYCPYIN